MKKLLFVLLTGLLFPVMARDISMDMSAEDLTKIFKGLESAHITIPKNLVKEGLDLKADKLELGAKMVEHKAQQFEGEDRAKWERVASLKKELASAVRALPVKDFSVTFKHMPEMLKLKARCYDLKARLFEAKAEQTTGELKSLLERKARHFKFHSDAIGKVLKALA